MYRFLRSPRWLAAHAVVAVVAVLFVSLGFWQLRRLEERRLDNQVLALRLAAPPTDLDLVLESLGEDVAASEYLRVTTSGIFDPTAQVLLRSRTFEGQAGFHVVTPLVRPGGAAVLVNRGWIPLQLEESPPAPAPGTVTVEAVVRLTQTRPALGPADPSQGVLTQFNRVDIPRIEQQSPYDLYPVYLDLIGQQPGQPDGLPVSVGLPSAADEGNHLAYAIQWFSFALIGLVGYAALVRKTGRRGMRAVPSEVRGQVGDHLDGGEL